MTKRISALFILLSIIFLTFPVSASSFYDPRDVANNLYGIGIVNHSDLEDASQLVNSNGDWGYVTVVVTEDQQQRELLQNFFDECRRLHLIPILRIATGFENGNWKKPDTSQIDSWVEFFNSLNWVIENRYIIIGNEPNHAKEWGGVIEPGKYAFYLKEFSQKLKQSNSDYFILPAALDYSADGKNNTLKAEGFIREMLKEVSDFYKYVDGINSHSYPNPNFSGSPWEVGPSSIKGYSWEKELIRSLGFPYDFPVFITETGWSNKSLTEEQISNYYKTAFNEIWLKDKDIVAVTPFILNYTQQPFLEFSWKKEDGSFYRHYFGISEIDKIKGNPRQYMSGEIILRFLNPFGVEDAYTRGYVYTRNTGQNIWNEENTKVVIDDKKSMILEDVHMKPLNPFSSGLIVFSFKYPQSGSHAIKVGLLVEGEQIDKLSLVNIVTFAKPKDNPGLLPTLINSLRNRFN